MTERRGEIKWNRAEPLTPRSPVNVKVSGIKSELTDDLTRLEHGKPSGGNIGLDDLVPIKDGDHFIALPTGTVS